MMLLPGGLVLLAFFSVASSFREAGDEEFPFQVSIQTLEKRHLCGGAIITPKWILTASFCLRSQASVRICYGAADSNSPLGCVIANKIYHENEFSLQKKRRLALVELEKPLEFSKTVKQGSLPRSQVALRNTTKLSGWKTTLGINLPPSLYVSDKYYIIPTNCKGLGGFPVNLEFDEFCGIDENSENHLHNPGSIVSKRAIILGILAETPPAASEPYIYVKLSEHEQWIKEVLKSDTQHITWADEVPKDSATAGCFSLVLLGISSLFIRFF